MTLNPLEGQKPQGSELLYAAADTLYFDLYARPLIVSAARNCADRRIHIHVYNPNPAQIQWAQQYPNCSISWETVDNHALHKIACRWTKRKDFVNDRQIQMYKKSQTMPPEQFGKLVSNTYYACVRFVRLNQLLSSESTCLSLDVDGIIRAKFSMTFSEQDIYCYQKPKDGTHLAGALLFQSHSGSRQFLSEYAECLEAAIQQDDLYWFLDQVILDQLIPKYRRGLLPMSYIDWAMRADSAIWSAKGKRKDLEIFKREIKKYHD
jgi:hypothetical protein